MLVGFKKKFIKVNTGKIFCRFKGNGPPLLLLHGYPQTHVMWHKTAPELSKYFTVVVADLRGYGDSFVLPGGINHKNYCLLYTSPSPRDATLSRMPSSA